MPPITPLPNSTTRLRLVIGAHGGIGNAVGQVWAEDPNTITLGISRQAAEPSDNSTSLIHLSCDHSDEHIDTCLASISSTWANVAIDRVVIATGMLTADRGPEKSLQQCQRDHWMHSMAVNAWLPMQWLQRLEGLLKRQQSPCVIAVLSARVGSIEDNRLGGWHSYRSSKAALNMLLKTVGIEWGRTLPHTKIMAFHPGTTDTALSKPFQKNVPAGKLFQPQWVAQRLDQLMANAPLDGQCSYLDWDGKSIPW